MQVSGTPVDLLSLIPTDVRWIAAGLIAVAALVFGWWQLRRAARALVRIVKRNSFEDNLTVVAAAIATGVSATGMWKFAGDVLHLWWPLRIVLFAFIEIAIITSAVRAKRSMRENFKAGVDGIAVWALACLTAVLSSLDAASFGEAVFRLAAPLVTAWLWERGMRLERHRLRGTSSIHWRITPERIAVRLGLAEASDRTAGEVDAHRRLTRVALAAKRAKALREAGAPDRKLRTAFAKLDKAMDQAVELAGLAVDESRQKALLAQIDALNSTEALAKRQKVARWASLVDEQANERANAAMEELVRLDAAEASQRARDKAALTLMALTERVTPNVITDRVTSAVTHEPIPAWRNGHAVTSAVTPLVTPSVTVERVTPAVTFDVTDPSVYTLERMFSSDPYVTPAVTPHVTDDRVTEEPEDAPKTQVMRAFWDAEVAKKSYPAPKELAEHAGVHPSLASRKRREWVAELPWRQRHKARQWRDKTAS